MLHLARFILLYGTTYWNIPAKPALFAKSEIWLIQQRLKIPNEIIWPPDGETFSRYWLCRGKVQKEKGDPNLKHVLRTSIISLA